ncbi:MAG: ATP-binding protein [Rhizomicrobium sp.]|jgi:signal transduction histidine kinase/ActR/RegA family two-component response regulator
MAEISLENSERRHTRVLDFLVGGFVAACLVGLFVFDISEPRGVVDGVGYAAVVALCVRFGGTGVIGCAILTTILTVVGSFLVPDTGVSVAGMWANRGFAIAEIWIVAVILMNRLRLEAYIAGRENKLHVTQTALGTIVREALLSDGPMAERVRFIVELSADTLGVDTCSVAQREQDTSLVRVVDFWDRRNSRHIDVADYPANEHREFLESLHRNQVVFADDVLTSPIYKSRLQYLAPLGVRAHMVAETNRGLGSISFGFGQPHHWTSQEIAFARAVANLVALLFAEGRNAQTLATLDLVGEGIYVEDRSGVVRYANRAARAFAKDDAAQSIQEFPRPPTSLVSGSDMYEIPFEGRDLEIQRMRLPDGGILARINDVTARNSAVLERRQMEARLQQSAKMEAIGQLAGGVAHDFNNILGSIMGFAGFLEQDLSASSPEHGFAERILSACERGKDLVEQILAFSRTRSVERGVVDLGLLIARSRDFLGDLLPSQVTLTLQAPDTPLPVFASAVQIGQLITNLCVNARDAFDGHEGVIGISARSATAVEIESLKRGAKAEDERVFGDVPFGRSCCLLRVEDNGPGIEPNILDHIFEPFFTTKGKHRGSGLGLAVVHGVVEAAGGACHLRSGPGRGTTFSIFFPCALETETSPEPSALESQDLRGSERILIVDDERDITDMLVIGLGRLGYETVGVNDPLEALAALAEDPDAFDVIITDQVMPGMRGLDLIRRAKRIKPSIRAAVCTGYGDGANEDVARDAGADAFFHKPADARQIARSLRNPAGRAGG